MALELDEWGCVVPIKNELKITTTDADVIKILQDAFRSGPIVELLDHTWNFASLEWGWGVNPMEAVAILRKVEHAVVAGQPMSLTVGERISRLEAAVRELNPGLDL